VLDKTTRTKLEQVMGVYIATWSEALLAVEFSSENAPLLTRILIPLEIFARRFPALLEGQAERIQSLIPLLTERETNKNYLLMMQSLLQVARLSMPLNIKSQKTIEQLSAKLCLLVHFQAQPVVEQAAGCLAALTKASGPAHYGTIHKLANELHQSLEKGKTPVRFIFGLGVLWQQFDFELYLPQRKDAPRASKLEDTLSLILKHAPTSRIMVAKAIGQRFFVCFCFCFCFAGLETRN